MAPFAVILDVDGTLVDSNDAHAQAWVDAFNEAGRDVSSERVRRAIGMGGDKLMPHVAGIAHDSREGSRISQRRGEIFHDRYLPHLAPFPRVRDLVLRFTEDGFTVVVASSAQSDELSELLSNPWKYLETRPLLLICWGACQRDKCVRFSRECGVF